MFDKDTINIILSEIEEYQKGIVQSLVGEGPGIPNDFAGYVRLRGQHEAYMQVKAIIRETLEHGSRDPDAD